MQTLRKMFLLTIFIKFVLYSSNSLADDLTVFDISDDYVNRVVSGLGSSTDSLHVIGHGVINFHSTVTSVDFYQKSNSTGVTVSLMVNIESETNGFMYKNKYRADILLGALDINWAESYFSLPHPSITSINVSENPSYLRNDLDKYLSDKIIQGQLYSRLLGLKFNIDLDKLKMMNKPANYMLRMNDENITIDLR